MWLLYIERGFSIGQIAKKFKRSKSHVLKRLKKCKIPTRPVHSNRDKIRIPPYGYRKYRDKLAKDINEQKAITMIVKLHKENLSLRKIQKTLQTNGILPRIGTKWHIDTIRRIIKKHPKKKN